MDLRSGHAGGAERSGAERGKALRRPGGRSGGRAGVLTRRRGRALRRPGDVVSLSLLARSAGAGRSGRGRRRPKAVDTAPFLTMLRGWPRR